MIVTVNEDPVEMKDEATVEDLISIMGIRFDMVAVEIDGEICPRAIRHFTTLRQGMYIEVVSFVGDGR